MTKAEIRQIQKYLRKIRKRLYDFSIDADTWRAELVKLDEIITEVMVTSIESEDGPNRVMLFYLEGRARQCREIILKLMERKK